MATWNDVKETIKKDCRDRNIQYGEESSDEFSIYDFGFYMSYIPADEGRESFLMGILHFGYIDNMSESDFKETLKNGASYLGGFFISDGCLFFRYYLFFEQKNVEEVIDELYTFINRKWNENGYYNSNVTSWESIKNYINNQKFYSEDISDGKKSITSDSGKNFIVNPHLQSPLLLDIYTIIENVSMNSIIRILELVGTGKFLPIDGAFLLNENCVVRRRIFYNGFSFQDFERSFYSFNLLLSDIETKAFNCPHCGTENSITNKFCNRCGKEI